MLASSMIDTSAMEKAFREYGGESEWEFVRPEFPEFKNTGTSSIRFVGERPSDEALALIRALLTYYDANKLQLEVSYEQRMADCEERQRELLANPPEAKNLIIRHWRLDQRRMPTSSE